MSLNIPPIIVNAPKAAVSVPDYPSAGVGVTTGCDSITNVTNLPYLRVDSYSAAVLPNNAAIIAVAAQQNDLLNQPPIVRDDKSSFDELELSRRSASRVYIATCLMDQSGFSPTPVRYASVVNYDNIERSITISVDADIYANAKTESIWVLDGDFNGKQFSVERKVSPNLLIVYPYNFPYTQPVIDSSWTYVAFCNTAPTIPSVSIIKSLPYIEMNGVALPAMRPQIATNPNLLDPSVYYVYVIAEAPVNGVNQLFFFSFKFGSDFQVNLWKQLTFDGENRNAKMQLDSHGNLHVVWESSRCQPNQILYGIIGPGSRDLANQTFISAVDKQSDLFRQINTISSNVETDKSKLTNYLTQSIVRMLPPVAIDLRAILDEYGTRGTMWSTYTSGSGSATITDNATISVSGTPSSEEFIAKCVLNHDENDVIFDGMFSQLSYQISFNLNLSSNSISVLSESDIQSLYTTFKNQFTPSLGNSGNNVYTQSGNNFTISSINKYFGDLIPITQVMKVAGASPSANDKLRHFMLAAIPEKARFFASNNETFSAYCTARSLTEMAGAMSYIASIEETYYTGKYKLALLISNAADITGPLNRQKFHTVRQFGDFFEFGTSVDYRIAVHYAKLRREESGYLASSATSNIYNEYGVNDGNVYDAFGVLKEAALVEFTGNIIVVANDIVQAAENFIPDFSDLYRQFDVTIGCLPGGQYPTLEASAYDGSLYENVAVKLDFTAFSVGPHTIVADPYQTNIALTDRNVSTMVIKSQTSETEPMNVADETWNSTGTYALNFGLNRTKVGLSQIPITFEGRCLSPSLSIDYCDRPHVSFQSDRNGNWQIYYTGTIDSQMPFRFDTRITNTDSISTNSTLAIDQVGRRLIAWQDDRNGPYQIYAAQSIKPLSCPAKKGLITELLTEGDHEYDPYSPYNPYTIFGSDICTISFEYTNEGASANFFFQLDVYEDQMKTSLKTSISGKSNISNWLVNGVQMPSSGYFIGSGQTVNVTYLPSQEDDISGEIYYIDISGNSIPLPYLYIYYCPLEQSPKCTIPCIYTNSTNNPTTVHFRVSAYSDQSLTSLVMSASSATDSRKWISDTTGFPSSGLSVSSHQTVSVFYNPEILPVDLFMSQNGQTIGALLCGVKYWIKIESNISGTYSTLDTFAFECSCDGITADIYRQDTDSLNWTCSGQGGIDTRLTASQGNALFPIAKASRDSKVYVAWEDYRYNSEIPSQKALSPDVYYCVYDATTNLFYSSAQGSYDKRVTAFTQSAQTRYYKPIILMGPFQNPTFLFNSATDIFRSSCSLHRLPSVAAQQEYPTNTGVFADGVDNLTTDDILNCLKFEVLKDDVIKIYQYSENLPIASVEKPVIRFDIVGPTGTYAVRFKNENETIWSDWLSIIPELPNYPAINTYTRRGDGSFRSTFEAFFVGPEHFIATWGLSSGSGNKTVNCEILTHNGKTPTMSLNVLAVYKELKYKVEMFSDSGYLTPLPTFGGYPVVSTNKLASISSSSSSSSSGSSSSSSSSVSDTIIPNDVSSILRDLDTLHTIYVKVTFEDPSALDNMLALQNVDKYKTLSAPGSFQQLTFNVLQQGLNAQYGLPLTKNADGIYLGSFPVQSSDGVCNKDGLAVLIVNVPDLSAKVFTPEYTIDSLDPYNANKPSLGDFYGAYSIIPEQKPEDIQIRDRQQLSAKNITLDEFHLKYNRESFCSYISENCIVGQLPISDGYIHDTTDQAASTVSLDVPHEPIANPNGNNAPSE